MEVSLEGASKTKQGEEGRVFLSQRTSRGGKE